MKSVMETEATKNKYAVEKEATDNEIYDEKSWKKIVFWKKELNMKCVMKDQASEKLSCDARKSN